jgi:hypothetical protein
MGAQCEHERFARNSPVLAIGFAPPTIAQVDH